MDENFLKTSFSDSNREPEASNKIADDSSALLPTEPEAPMLENVPLEKSFDSAVDPMPVVKVLSTRGVEYAMLTITLWLTVIAVLWILLALVNGGARFVILDVPLSIAIISLPVFAYLFLRRKKAELADPKLKTEPSKRRWTQFSQILAFLATLANLITFVYLIIAHLAGQVSYSFIKIVLDVAIILAVTGGVLVYYWHDEHRLKIQ